jgi:phosphate transport system protein
MKKFEHELANLKERVVEMGELAESMVAGASSALVSPGGDFIQHVRASEPRLDRFQVDIDREAIRLITIYSPMAKDLRFLLMIARINSEFERIGDQAVDNCEYVEMLEPITLSPPLDDLSAMSALTLRMVRDAREAFQQEDVARAQAVIKMDGQVDAMNAATFRDLLKHTGSDPATVTRCMSQILVARSLERIADHATNICEEVFYLVKGEDIRHQT